MRARRIVVAAVVLLGAAALWLVVGSRLPRERPASRTAGAPTATPAATAPTPAPTPTEAAPVVRRRSFVVPWAPVPTPSPTEPPPTETPSPRPGPSATPAVEECIAFRWSSAMSPVSVGQVLIEIQAENRCGRDLAAMDVWFEATGYRGGERLQSARGHLFDPLPRDGDGTVRIALPGSADWYDEIKVVGVPLIRP